MLVYMTDDDMTDLMLQWRSVVLQFWSHSIHNCCL